MRTFGLFRGLLLSVVLLTADKAVAKGLGLRLGGGFGFANSSIPVCCDASERNISASLGDGRVYLGEILYGLSSNFELGLGTSTLAAQKSLFTQTEQGVSRRTLTEVSGSVTPIFLMLYSQTDLGKGVRAVIGVGPSVGLGGVMTVTRDEWNVCAWGDRAKGVETYALDNGLGYRAYIGGEIALAHSVSLYVGVELQDISLGIEKRSTNYRWEKANGDVSEVDRTYEFSSDPPQKKPLEWSSSTSEVGGIKTAVYTYDDGTNVFTMTTTHDLSTGRNHQKIKGIYREQKTTADFNRLAPVIGVTIRF